MPRAFTLAAAFAAAALIASTTTTRGSPQSAPHIDPALFSSLQWRHIGPFRGGRTTAVAGVPSAPHVLYIGGSGGVWKTTDAGRTWSSIFDGQPTASIGAIAVSPADPNTLYAGTGEGESMGSGLYTSIDAGRTWTRLGLAEAP